MVKRRITELEITEAASKAAEEVLLCYIYTGNPHYRDISRECSLPGEYLEGILWTIMDSERIRLVNMHRS